MARIAEGGLRKRGYFKLSYEDKPLVSVVTIVYNSEKYLEQTIQSVITQEYDNVEYIIIDGGSTDGSLDIIRRYNEQIDYWLSEADRGISHAFNKGVQLCSGELIGIVNADDWYELNTISTVVAEYKKLGIGLYYGRLNFWHDTQFLHSCRSNIDRIYHPTVFVSKSYYQTIGGFNEEYSIAMDVDFLLRARKEGLNFYYINKNISNMRHGGISGKQAFTGIYEILKIKNKLSPSWHNYIYFIRNLLEVYIARFFIAIGLQKIVYFVKSKLST